VRRTLLILAAVALACPVGALAHGGAMDECGCRADRQAGGYHCHRGQFANKSFRDKQELLALLAPATTCTPPRPESPAPVPALPSAPDIPDHTRTPGTINPEVTQDNISEKDRRAMLARYMRASDEACGAVTRTFYQGAAANGDAIWNLSCANGKSFVLLIKR
jgi:hypothetical protein